MEVPRAKLNLIRSEKVKKDFRLTQELMNRDSENFQLHLAEIRRVGIPIRPWELLLVNDTFQARWDRYNFYYSVALYCKISSVAEYKALIWSLKRGI